MDIISSARLDLISLPASFLEASLARDSEAAAQWLGMPVPPERLETRWLMQYRLEQLRNDPTVQPWLLRAMILREERFMVGHAGFHGQPGAEYLEEYAPDGVEIGYTVYPSLPAARLRDRSMRRPDGLGNAPAERHALCGQYPPGQ